MGKYQAGTPRVESHQSASRNPLRVFLVEDSLVLQELIIESLKAIPGIVLVGMSETENDAIQKLIIADCDVLIVDIQLKQGNGINLLRRLEPLEKKILKIVFSNHVSSTYRRLCDQYGVEFFFDKTSEFSRLCMVLTELSGHATH